MPTTTKNTFDPNELISGFMQALNQGSEKATDPAEKQVYKNLYSDLASKLGSAGMWTTGVQSGATKVGSIDWNALQGAVAKANTVPNDNNSSNIAIHAIGSAAQKYMPRLQTLINGEKGLNGGFIGRPNVTDKERAAMTTAVQAKAQPSTLYDVPGFDNPVVQSFIKSNNIQTTDQFYKTLNDSLSSKNTLTALENVRNAQVEFANAQYDMLMQSLQKQAAASNAAIDAQYATLAKQYKQNAEDAKFLAVNDWTARGLAFSGMLNKAEKDIGVEYQQKIDQMYADKNAAKLKLVGDMINATANLSLQKLQSNLNAYSDYALKVASIMDSDNRSYANALVDALGISSSSSSTATGYTDKDLNADIKIVTDKTFNYDDYTRGTAGMRVILNTPSSGWLGSNKAFAQLLQGNATVRPEQKTGNTVTAPALNVPKFTALAANDARDMIAMIEQKAGTPKALAASIIWAAANPSAENAVPVNPLVQSNQFFQENPQYKQYESEVNAIIKEYSPGITLSSPAEGSTSTTNKSSSKTRGPYTPKPWGFGFGGGS